MNALVAEVSLSAAMGFSGMGIAGSMPLEAFDDCFKVVTGKKKKNLGAVPHPGSDR